MYKNHEGYSDPTAGAVIGQMMKEYKKQQKDARQRQNEIKSHAKVYVVSKYAGDTEANTKAAISYCRYVIAQNKMPIASHLMYPAILRDSIPAEREMGTAFGLALLSMCDEVWCFGKDYSQGMRAEIQEAKCLGKQILFFEEVPR